MKKRLLSVYLNTFPNIDVFYKNNGGKAFVEQLFIDRSSFLKKASKVFSPHFLYGTYRFFEPLISLFVVSGLLFKALFARLRRRKIATEKVDRLFLNYAHLLVQRCKTADIFDNSEFWLEAPFTDISVKELEGKTLVTVYDALLVSDILKSYGHAIAAVLYVGWHNPNRYIRRSYTAFEFFLTFHAIAKFPVETELVFANHIDRWAVLFDACPQKRKILVQHGIETKTADWPVKLKTVTTVYAFNEELGNDLRKALLVHDPEFRYMKPTIHLVDDKEDGNYKVLIVCHPAALRDKEAYLISHLQQPNITVYAKTHYTTPDLSFYEELTEKYRFHLITTQVFPKVNTLISYRSTLVSEYEICGVPALLYSDYKTLDDLVEKVKQDADSYKG